MKLLPIVEGHGDLQAVPVLIRRILQHHARYDVEVLPAHKRGDLLKVKTNFDSYFKMAIKEQAAIVWVIDFDCPGCDCLVQEAAELYAKAQAIRADWPIKIVFMVQEFETLFLAEPVATRRVLKEIPDKTPFPVNPESVRGAKEWLSKALPSGFAYKETVHQVKLAAAVDLDSLRATSPSYRHFEKSVLGLLEREIPAC